MRVEREYSSSKDRGESKDKLSEILSQYPTRFANVSTSLINIDQDYQRTETFNSKRAQNIAKGWNLVQCGTLLVSLRRSGKYFCADGQHRFKGAVLASVAEVPCIVVDLSSETNAEAAKIEARIFLAQPDNRRSLSPYDRHKAALWCGKPTAIQMEDLADKLGRIVSPRTGPNTVKCLSTFMDFLSSRFLKGNDGPSGYDVLLSIIPFLKAVCEDNAMPAGLVTAAFKLEKHHWKLHDARLSLSNSRWLKAGRKIGYVKLTQAVNSSFSFAKKDRNMSARALGLALNSGLQSPRFYEHEGA